MNAINTTSRCNHYLKARGQPVPRTCGHCGLGLCPYEHQRPHIAAADPDRMTLAEAYVLHVWHEEQERIAPNSGQYDVAKSHQEHAREIGAKILAEHGPPMNLYLPTCAVCNHTVNRITRIEKPVNHATTTPIECHGDSPDTEISRPTTTPSPALVRASPSPIANPGRSPG